MILLAIVGYAVVGIGSPLFGVKVFAATDLLAGSSPYRDAGLAGTEVQNSYLNDTIDSYLPGIALFVSALYEGQFAAWNPYIIGGAPLGASLNLGLLNPIALPYFVLPIWLAPGYVKLLEIGFAVGGTFLFLRRIGLRRPAALLGGLVFASSGFMVAWTNWPHTRVAALIPALFWALDRLVVRRRLSDGLLVTAITAFMIFGGFPAVAGYGLLFGAGYLVVRTVTEYLGQWRRILGIGSGAATAVLAGVALTAVQLVPFLSYMSAAHVNGREQSPGDHLLPETLVTLVAPWAMGSTDPQRPPFWYLYVNLVESLAYVGAGAAVLLVVALAMPGAGRRLLPRGVWAYLVAATGFLLVILYVGRFPLAVLQQLPVLFSENFVGRTRSVLGFLLGALAAIGFQVLLDRRAASAAERAAGNRGATNERPVAAGHPRGAGLRRWYGVAVWLGAALVGAVAWWDARKAAYATSARDGVPPAIRVDHLNLEMLKAVGLVAVAVLLAAAVWWLAPPYLAGASGARAPDPDGTGDTPPLGRNGTGDTRPLGRNGTGADDARARPSDAGRARGWRTPGGRRRALRLSAAALLPVLIAGQALALAVPYWPRVDRDTFYPVTDTHEFLAGHLGHERFAGSGRGMYVGADSAARLRALTGHFFLNGRFAETIDGLPGRQFGDPPTYMNFAAVPSVVGSPVLDRLAVKYFVASPAVAPLGKARHAEPDAGGVRLRPGRPVTAPVPGSGPLRGVGLTVAGEATPGTAAGEAPGPGSAGSDSGGSVQLVLTDESGEQVASAERVRYDVTPGSRLWIPVAAEDVPAEERLTARLTLRGGPPLEVRASGGWPAMSTVAPADDGLRMAYVGSAVVYERLNAVPRIRWASHTRVEPDPQRRVALVASGELAPDEVVLDTPPDRPAAGGGTAEVEVLTDGMDEIEVSVRAREPGYLVVADALQQDWVATVDGEPAPLVAADHGLVAVAVGEGEHTVRVAYRMPYGNLGGWLSGFTLLLIAVLLAVDLWRHPLGTPTARTGTD